MTTDAIVGEPVSPTPKQPEAHPDPVRTIAVAARETATAATDSLPRLVPGTVTSQEFDPGG